VLVTTLTKRMAEDLTEHYKELNVKVAYSTPISTPLNGWTSSGTCAWGSMMC